MKTNPYSPQEPGTPKSRKLLWITLGVLALVSVLLLSLHHSHPNSQQNKYIKSATAAARKDTPNAQVSNITVSHGFAEAVVTDPSSPGQAGAGNTTIFKVNRDGSMQQLAKGSYFSPIDLLNLGIPLATQAALTKHDISQVQQTLANQCGYDGGTNPGFNGFDGSFSPNSWQIDYATLSGLEQALSNAIINQNANAAPGKAVMCVNATPTNSNATTDTSTYISTFTLHVQFITDDGTLQAHTITFATGPNYYRSYTLDGKNIQ